MSGCARQAVGAECGARLAGGVVCGEEIASLTLAAVAGVSAKRAVGNANTTLHAVCVLGSQVIPCGAGRAGSRTVTAGETVRQG